MLKKIDKMYALFGFCKDNVCKKCCNYKSERYHDKTYRKCIVYGCSNSEATDWKASYTACGLFNQPWDGVTKVIKSGRINEPEKPLEGQMSLF